jgi:hypothetical protein
MDDNHDDDGDGAEHIDGRQTHGDGNSE